MARRTPYAVLLTEQEERENYERRFPQDWLEAIAPLGTDWHKEFLEVAPVLIVIFRIDYGLDGERKIKHYDVNETVGIASGFLQAASARWQSRRSRSWGITSSR